MQKRSYSEFDSGAQVYLGIAMRNYREFVAAGQQTSAPWQREELAVSSFFYCFGAIAEPRTCPMVFVV